MSILTELDAEWAEWMAAPAIRTWQRQQPASWDAILTYRNGGVRPSPTTRIGRALTFQTAAWLEARGLTPTLYPVPDALKGWPAVVTVTGALSKMSGNVWHGDSFQLNVKP